MSRTEDALDLAEETLAQLELGTAPLASIVLRCLRLARILGWEDVQNWMRLELRGYSADLIGGQAWDGYAEWSGRRAREGQNDQPHYYWTASIEVIEAELLVAKKDLDALQVPTFNVTDAAEGHFYSFQQTRTEKIVDSILAKRAAKAATVSQWTRVTASLRGSIEEWLSRVVVQLKYREIVETAFNRARQRFDALLSERAPEVASKLAAAYSRAYSSDPEEWSQALTSCRRAIKALADEIYSPTNEQPTGRPLDGDHYRNRLIQFVSEQLSSESQKEALEAEIDLVVRRVESLDGLASKGVHSEVDERDLELAVVHTYLLAGELLTLLPASENLRPPQKSDPEEQAAGQSLTTERDAINGISQDSPPG